MASTAADKTFDRWNELLQVAPEADVPSVVYHYTNAAGLIGIIENGLILATDKHFLNDKTEVRHGNETAISGLIAENRKADSSEDRELLQRTCEYIQSDNTLRHFIFSMSERGDDLSQWRGYANEGDGYSIGFDAKHLRYLSAGGEGIFGFNRVSYSNVQFKALIARLKSEYIEALRTDVDVENTANCFSSTIDTAASFYKHGSFRYEREWRIVSFVYPDDPDEIFVRNANGRIVPYVKIPLADSNAKLPILEIGIGPAVQNPNTRMVIEDLCKRAGIAPDIYNAATPYVRY